MLELARGIAGGVAVLCCLAGCATPANVKQALVAKDEAYKQNAELMRQYARLADSYEERARVWFVHTQTRLKLLSAISWITSTPQAPPKPPDMSSQKWQELLAHRWNAHAEVLGEQMVKQLNSLRFSGLPAAGDFKAGTSTPKGDMTRLLQSVPTLARLATEKAEAEWAASLGQRSGPSPFDEYVADVGSLRQLNKAVRAYLEIDIGPSDEDVREIAAAIRELNK